MGAQAVRLTNVDIDNALANKDFEVLFQPIFDLGNGALARMETFVRWRHPSLGVLPPGAFISFFETQGRMSELTRYVLAEALDGYLGWRGPFEPGFSINLALTDITDEAFPTHFTKIMRDREFPADLVTLECPMPPVDVDLQSAAESFKRLRECGARLAIEVRGRANDFLRTIDPFPFDEIKTGGASILRFARTVRGPGLSAISDLLDIANTSNAVITAVGVEDQASLAALRGLGFTAAQGNHLSKVGALNDFRPGRVNEVRELLGLQPLSSDDLIALFRTDAPTLKTTDASTASQNAADEETAALSAGDKTAEMDDEERKRLKAKHKAKMLALAKRAKARELRKAAAIQRAKAKAAQAQSQPEKTEGAASSAADAAARALQDRLAREYVSGAVPQKAREQAPVPAASSEPQAMSEKQSAPKVDSDAHALIEQAKDDDGAAVHHTENATEIAPSSANKPAVDAESAPMRLAVGAVGAYFRPGVRVGGEAVINDPPMNHQAPLKTTKPAPSAFSAAPSDFLDNAEQQFAFEDRQPSAPDAASDKIEQPNETAAALLAHPESTNGDAEASPLDDVITQGHLQDEYALEEPPVRNLRKSGFLNKRYRLPNHFWPKSWKRRYRLWRRDRAASGAQKTQAG